MSFVGACMTTRNEQDIIGACIENLLDQGVDRILVADQSTDTTRRILASFPEVTVYDASGPWYEQEAWMNRLAWLLAESGCGWIVPADADEFWQAPGGLDYYLNALDPDIDIVNATLWHHRDWDYKFTVPERLSKVCFRWHPGAVLAVGSHSVSILGARVLPKQNIGGVTIRHLQYRGFEHFKSKIRDHSARLPQWQRDRGDGAHLTAHEHDTDAELEQLWLTHTSQGVVYDPILIHGHHRIGA